MLFSEKQYLPIVDCVKGCVSFAMSMLQKNFFNLFVPHLDLYVSEHIKGNIDMVMLEVELRTCPWFKKISGILMLQDWSPINKKGNGG